MGYCTTFNGGLAITPPLTKEQVAYLTAFRRTDFRITDGRPHADKLGDWDLPLMPDGTPVNNGWGLCNDDSETMAIIDGVDEPTCRVQDSVSDIKFLRATCEWKISEDGTRLHCDGSADKFYRYVCWLEFMMIKFFMPWERTLNGELHWQGEDEADKGTITVRNGIKVETTASLSNHNTMYTAFFQ